MHEKAVAMNYLRSLSKAQWIWLIGVLLCGSSIIAAGWIEGRGNAVVSTVAFTTEMSIRDIAPKLEVTNKALARELGLSIEGPKRWPLKKQGVTQEKLDRAVRHLTEDQSSQLRYYIFAALVLWALVFLCRLGRPDRSSITQRREWYPQTPYILTLLAGGIICGFWLGKSPNPMEGIVKFLKSLAGLYPSIADKAIAMVFFLVLAVVGNKLICGWACPFGALQELLYSLPVLKQVKNVRIPFVISNGIRVGFLALALLLLFGAWGRHHGLVLYHSVNPFNLFNYDFSSASITVTIVLVLVLSLFVYRPFCQFICPFGLVSWIFETLSLARIRIDKARCNQCNACARACPLEAAKGLVAGKLPRADCYSCARCLKVCPQDAISYGWGFGRSYIAGSICATDCRAHEEMK